MQTETYAPSWRTRMRTKWDAVMERPMRLFVAVFVIFLLVYGASIFLVPKRYGRLIVGDGIYYYVYLRSAVLDGDLHFQNDYEIYQSFNTEDLRKKQEMLERKTPLGMPANLFSVGPAVLWTPIFLLTHFVASLTGLAGDGFAVWYEAPVMFLSIVYGFIGIVLMYRVAAGMFSKFAALVSILGIWLATNVVYYMGVSPSASHVLSLFASALFVYLWWRWWGPHPDPLLKGEGVRPHPDPLLKGEGVGPHPDPLLKGEGVGPHPDPLLKGEGVRPHPDPLLKGEGVRPHPDPLLKGEGVDGRTCWRWFGWGLSAGLMALVRWQDVLIVLLALLEWIRMTTADRPQTATAFGHRLPSAVLLGALFVAGMALAFVPQMFAWQILYGSLLTAPQGGGFFQWLRPEMLNVWFSTKRGLFSWSPILLLSVLGFVPLFLKYRVMGAAAILIFVAESYINSVVNDWWGGEAFGARRFISLMPFFVLGLAALIDALRRAAKTRAYVSQKAVVTILIAFIVWNNLFILQYNLWLKGIGHISAMPTLQEMTVDKFTAPFLLLDKLRGR